MGGLLILLLILRYFGETDPEVEIAACAHVSFVKRWTGPACKERLSIPCPCDREENTGCSCFHAGELVVKVDVNVVA